jgi:hypothetical protein
LDAMKGPKKGKLVKPTESLVKRASSLLDSVLGASEFVDNQMEFEPENCGCQPLLHVILELHRVLAVVVAGIPTQTGEDSLEQREKQAAEILQKRALVKLKEAREKLSSTWCVKRVCSLLASYVVPLFSVFRMCSTACTTYGWGTRKQSKKVSAAMADFAIELNELVQEMMNGIKELPSSETDTMFDPEIADEDLNIIGMDTVQITKAIVRQGQYKTRMRVEPVLQEMDEFLDEFGSLKEG